MVFVVFDSEEIMAIESLKGNAMYYCLKVRAVTHCPCVGIYSLLEKIIATEVRCMMKFCYFEQATNAPLYALPD
jgi:hypothetical protein